MLGPRRREMNLVELGSWAAHVLEGFVVDRHYVVSQGDDLTPATPALVHYVIGDVIRHQFIESL
jgi:hypothetical protein